MKRIARFTRALAATGLSLAFSAALVAIHAQELPVAPLGLSAEPDEDGLETLTRGPVHEAFAAPTDGNPKPGPVVPKQPPADIDEEPPALKPEGASWIPGYWEWDDELKDFLWVSGNWRVPPPNQRWVPPYWTEADGGFRRVAGFWISSDAGELEYRDPPPASLETGPASPAPADNYFWIPGSWSYYDTGYRWRTGYWSPYQPDWVWVPSRWSWTPAGCVYLPGFWDFRLAFRGQLFAPVYFQRPIYTQPGWCYRPRCVLDPSRLLVHLWIRPSCGSYYFGNYYGSHYANWNMTPWCHSQRQRGYHDPLLTWCNTHYRRQGIDYAQRVQGWHDHCERNADDRPSRTWKEQVHHVASGRHDPKVSQSILASDLREVAGRTNLPIQLTKLDDRDRTLARTAAGDIRKLHTERQKLEHEGRTINVARGDLKLPGLGEHKSGKPDSDNANNDKPTFGKPADNDGPRLGNPNPIADRVKNLESNLGAERAGRPEPKKLSLPKLSDAARQATTVAKPPTIKLPTTGSSGADPGKSASKPTVNLSRDFADRFRGLPDRSSSSNNTAGNNSNGNNTTGNNSTGSNTARSGSSNDSPKVPKITIPLSSQGNSSATTPRSDTGPKFSPPKVSIPNFSPPTGSEHSSASERSSSGTSNSQPRPSFNFPSRSSQPSGGGGSSASKPLSIPKIDIPRSSGSSNSKPSFSAPRIEIPRASSSSSSSGPKPSFSAPRIETPRVSIPRSSGSSNSKQPFSAPRIEMPRASSSSGSSRSSSFSPSRSSSIRMPSSQGSSNRSSSNSGGSRGDSRSSRKK